MPVTLSFKIGFIAPLSLLGKRKALSHCTAPMNGGSHPRHLCSWATRTRTRRSAGLQTCLPGPPWMPLNRRVRPGSFPHLHTSGQGLPKPIPLPPLVFAFMLCLQQPLCSLHSANFSHFRASLTDRLLGQALAEPPPWCVLGWGVKSASRAVYCTHLSTVLWWWCLSRL